MDRGKSTAAPTVESRTSRRARSAGAPSFFASAVPVSPMMMQYETQPTKVLKLQMPVMRPPVPGPTVFSQAPR